MRPPALFALPALAVLAACSQAAEPAGDWRLDGAASTVAFVSIKAGETAEAHRFTALQGTIAEDGAAEILIDLDSVDTGIEIRDERMREHFFQTDTYPQARISAAIDLAALSEMQPGDRIRLPIEAMLELHGTTLPVETEVFVTDAGDRVLVDSTAPVLLHAGDFGLGDGLATLQDLAGLPSITPVVPVSFSLVFERD